MADTVVRSSGLSSTLFVSVSAVARPTSVSVEVGSVKVPVFVIEEMTGVVSVLLVKVWLPVKVATVESMASVTDPEVPPPDNPVPAVTPVISPDSGVANWKKMAALVLVK